MYIEAEGLSIKPEYLSGQADCPLTHMVVAWSGVEEVCDEHAGWFRSDR